MSVKDLISAAFNKDASSFESTLQSIMQEKMAAAIQSRFSPAMYEEEVDLEEAKASEDDEDEEDEDEEELDEERTDTYVGTVKRDDPDYAKKVAELKSKTVGGHRVRGRAPTPEHKHLYQQGGALHRSSSQDIKPEHASRVDVYSRKPMKEETLNELSKKTLGSYTRKAASSMGTAAYDLAKKQSDADEVDRMTNRNMPNKFDTQKQMKKALGADDDSQQKNRRTIGNRMKGIDQATNKLSQ